MLTVIIGTATVALTGMTARLSGGKIAGLFGAFFLAVIPFHIQHSRYITTDMPMCFFVILTVFFCLNYERTLKVRFLLFSLMSTGLAISCKYNAVVIWLVPLMTYFLNWKKIQSKMLFFILTIIIPIGVFFIINPFAILDFPSFWRDISFELNHYSLTGHGANSSEPGWPHFVYQIRQIKNNIPIINFYLMILGILIMFQQWRKSLILFIFPVIYVIWMCQQTVNFHRNFVVIYPFVAILSATGLAWLIFELNGRISSTGVFRAWQYFFKTILIFIPLCLMLILYSNLYAKQWIQAKRKWNKKETRTQAIETINALLANQNKTKTKIGIAKELKVHPLDLEKLKFEFEIFDHADIHDSMSKFDYCLIGNYGSHDQLFHREDASLNRLSEKYKIFYRIHGGKTRRDIYSVNPEVLILK